MRTLDNNRPSVARCQTCTNLNESSEVAADAGFSVDAVGLVYVAHIVFMNVVSTLHQSISVAPSEVVKRPIIVLRRRATTSSSC